LRFLVQVELASRILTPLFSFDNALAAIGMFIEASAIGIVASDVGNHARRHYVGVLRCGKTSFGRYLRRHRRGEVAAS
jgi:hypothetical protein